MKKVIGIIFTGGEGGSDSSSSSGSSSSADSSNSVDSLGSIGSVSLFGCGVKRWCKPYNGAITLEDIVDNGDYKGYDDMIYLTGDFSKCVEKMEKIDGRYHLFYNNCVHVSLSILSEADTAYKTDLKHARLFTAPILAHNYLKKRVEPREAIIRGTSTCTLICIIAKNSKPISELTLDEIILSMD